MYPQRYKNMAVVLKVLKAVEARFCALTADEVQRRMLMAEMQQHELVCVAACLPAPACLRLPACLCCCSHVLCVVSSVRRLDFYGGAV